MDRVRTSERYGALASSGGSSASRSEALRYVQARRLSSPKLPPMSDRPLSDDVRALQVIWIAVVAGALIAVGVLWWLAGQSETPPMAEMADTLFLINAGVSIAAIVGGFTVQRRLPQQAAAADTETGAMNRVRTFSILALAVMEGSALVAGVMAFLTGNALNLAFVVPFLAFAALFFPSDDRIASLVRR